MRMPRCIKIKLKLGMIEKFRRESSFWGEKFNSRLKIFLGKLKSRLSSPFKLIRVHPFGVVDLLDERICREFKVNGQRVKQYWGDFVARMSITTTLKNP